jgi:GNAT superfamily N-acetyltransferase
VGTSFRPAARDDAPALAGLAGALGYPTRPSELRERLEVLLGRETHAVLVAEEEGTAVGWLHVFEEVSLVAPPRALIAGLVVDEGRRGTGIGRGLVERAEAWAAGRGLTSMRVRSRDGRGEAHAFYRQLGYELSKTQALFWKSLGDGA